MVETLDKVMGGSRGAVLRALEGESRSVSEIVEHTGLSQPNVSNHLSRLREQGLVQSRRAGKKIYYSVSSPELVRALLSLPNENPLSEHERDVYTSTLYPEFEHAIAIIDHESARSLVNRALADGLPWQDLYLRVFQPLLVSVGEQWARGDISVSEERAASSLIERIMSHVASLRIPAVGGNVEIVVSCAQDEQHQIGARMVADFLADAGYNVVFLGANVPNDALIRYVARCRPNVLVVSASSEASRPALIQLVEDFRARFTSADAPRLLVGGRLTRIAPDLFKELGIQQTPETAEELPALLRSHLNGKAH